MLLQNVFRHVARAGEHSKSSVTHGIPRSPGTLLVACYQRKAEGCDLQLHVEPDLQGTYTNEDWARVIRRARRSPSCAGSRRRRLRRFWTAPAQPAGPPPSPAASRQQVGDGVAGCSC